MKKYVIFLNGEYNYSQKFMDNLILDDTLCFCADGGVNFIYKYGKIPEIIIGDLDSIEKKVLDYYEKKNVLIKKFPRDKDFTDFELILAEIENFKKNGKSKNKDLEKIFVVGGLGKRIDMTLNNLFLMERYKNLVFLSENEEIFYAEKSFALKNKKGYEFSIIPISENIEKLTLKGFKFEIDKVDVERKSSRLVSNVVTEELCKVDFEKGKMLIILRNF